MRYRRCPLLPPLIVAVVVAAASGGCGSTKIVDTWRHPEQTGPLDFERTLVVGLAPDLYMRRVAEDGIVERIGADRAAAANDVIAGEKPPGRQAVEEAVAKGEFDGVLTVGLAGTRRRVARDAAQGADEPFYAFYDRAAAFTAHDYGESSDTVYRIETRIYSVKDDRLVWIAITDTVNPNHIDQTVADVAKAVGGELRKQKLVR